MIRRLAVLALAAIAFVPAAAHAGTWRYRFQPGKTYRYHYEGHSNLSMKMMMVGPQKQTLDVVTDFAVQVKRRMPDGRFDVVVKLERVELTGRGGRTIRLSNLPAEVRTMRAHVTDRGRFEFYRRVVVQVRDDGTYAMGVIDPKHGTASATAAAGGEEVTATASIDPKTGRVSATISRRKARAHTHAETKEKPVQNVDVLPVRVLALMALPEGPVTPGSSFDLGTPAFTVHETAGAPSRCGRHRCGVLTVAAKMNASQKTMNRTAGAMGAPAGDQAEMAADQKQANADMAAGMADMQRQMGGMGMGGGMPGAGGAAPGASPAQPEMKMSIDAKMRFDERKGNLFDVEGTISQSTRMTGVSLDGHTHFRLAAR